MSKQQRRTQHQRTQRRTEQHAVATSLQTTEEGQPSRRLQKQRKSSSHTALLMQAEPENAGTFDRPRGRSPARIQPEWNGQRGEDHPQR